jgi:hypothetical protein
MTQGEAITQRGDFVFEILSGLSVLEDRSFLRVELPPYRGCWTLPFRALLTPLFRRQLQLHLIFGENDFGFRQGRSPLG